MISTYIIALCTASIPLVVQALNPQRSAPWLLPVIAAGLFIISFQLPEIAISNQTDTFTQHAVGGGVYCALLFVYFSRLYNWQLTLPVQALLLFAWVSAFGAANELFELALNQLGLAQINLQDTNWDILANTVGAYVGYAILVLVQHYQTTRRNKS